MRIEKERDSVIDPDLLGRAEAALGRLKLRRKDAGSEAEASEALPLIDPTIGQLERAVAARPRNASLRKALEEASEARRVAGRDRRGAG